MPMAKRSRLQIFSLFFSSSQCPRNPSPAFGHRIYIFRCEVLTVFLSESFVEPGFLTMACPALLRWKNYGKKSEAGQKQPPGGSRKIANCCEHVSCWYLFKSKLLNDPAILVNLFFDDAAFFIQGNPFSCFQAFGIFSGYP
jgi:hypothetical protein